LKRKIYKPEEKSLQDFLIKNAKEIVKEAYIAENDTKVIATIFKNYRVETQNSLLKILEEPPKNIVFIIGVLSKSVLLPTIRSRMMIKNTKTQDEKQELGLDFKRLDIKMIYEFLNNKSF
jgi:DNA polymerase-3 subunit delta'